MAWWAAAALGVQAVGALGSWNEGRKAKDLAKAENAEGLRRLELEQKAQFGSATARAGASDGIEFDSESTSAYLGEMAAEMRRQYEWQRRMGAQRAAAMGRQNRWNLFNQGAGALYQFGQNNNWWQKRPDLTSPTSSFGASLGSYRLRPPTLGDLE